MPRFAANLSMLFTEAPFLDRFAAAAEAGFTAVEYHFPYDFPPAELAQRLTAHGLTQVLFNLPPGDFGTGERGIACLPDRGPEFRDGVGRALAYAKALGCAHVNCLAGIAPAGADLEQLKDTLIANLRFAAAKFEAARIRLLIEPINVYDMPGFYLNRSGQALAILDAVGSDNLKLQYDIYHMQRMEGELAQTIERLLARIGHIQIAGNPGRHEPDQGEINYPFLFALLDGLSYAGWIGCEYWPARTTAEGLGWLKGYL